MAFGDSITDGATSTNNADADWPSMLAKRLNDAGVTNLAVINEGISGNRVLADGAGVSVLARFERDVLAQPGIKYLVFMEAINDIGGASRAGATPVTAEEIIAIYKQMIARAHMRGIKVIGATLTPYEGAGYYSEPGEVIRTAVNEWIRTTGMLDGMVDFDLATRDPANPKKFRPGYQYPRQSASQRCRVQGDGGVDRFVVVWGETLAGRACLTPTTRSSRAWSARIPGTPSHP